MADDSVDPVAGDPVEQPAVTGRPADVPEENSTFGTRATSSTKAVSTDTAENKSVVLRKAARKSK